MNIPYNKIAIALADAIRKDRANRYILVKDWTLPKLADVTLPDFENEWFKIVDSTITVKAYPDGYYSDGSTLSPDKIGKWMPLFAALFHDPWYASIDELAKAWGWSAYAVRKLGDELFADIMVATGCPRWLARAYLTGLRLGGGIVRWITTAFCIAAVATAVGCQGCAIPGHFDDQPVTPPQYQETTNGK